MSRLKSWFQDEKKKVLSLPKEKRFSYIWTYYGFWIVAIVLAAAFAVWFVWHSTHALRENWICVAFPNASADAGEHSQIWEDYLADQDFDLTEKNLLFQDGLYFDPKTQGGTNNSYYQSFVAMVETGQLDAVCMERGDIEALGKSGRLLDLSSDSGRDIYEKYEDRLVYSIPYDTDYSTSQVPVGVDVSDSLLVTGYGLYEGSCVLSVGAYSKNIDAVEQFLDWILEGKSGKVAPEILSMETEGDGTAVAGSSPESDRTAETGSSPESDRAADAQSSTDSADGRQL